MHLIKTIVGFLIIYPVFLVANFSCEKTSASNLQRIDTVKYEAILSNNTSDWCVTMVNPSDIYTDSNNAPMNGGSFECGESQTIETTFTIKKYTNRYIYLGMSAYNQWYGVYPYPQSAVTLNIYLNGTIVATQSSTIKDSIRYLIY